MTDTSMKLTGGANAASMIESTPISGDCRSCRNPRTKKASLFRDGGSSLIMFVATAPGSAALKYKKVNQ